MTAFISKRREANAMTGARRASNAQRAFAPTPTRCAISTLLALMQMAAHAQAVGTQETATKSADTSKSEAAAAPAVAASKSEVAPTQDGPQTVIVTGTTSRNRTLLTSSADITVSTLEDLAVKAPRSTVEVMELVPGIFVEGTAGPVSNNYSVRGFQGGAQNFINILEDGLPVLFTGGGPDRFFQNDVTVARVETVRGGPSGVLTTNAGAASINFISKRPSFEKATGEFRLMGATYDEQRGDFYYSAPVSSDLAYSLGGYVDSTKGVRDSPFTYQTYHLKGMVEKRFEGGGYLTVTAKVGDEHDPYQADMPFKFSNGKVSGVPGLDPRTGNVAGAGFGSIILPVSCATGACQKDFSMLQGIHITTKSIGLNFERPLNDDWDLFARARYMQFTSNFNGIFPGSGAGNAGLASADTYLNDSVNSPIASLLNAGRAAFPSATQFGLVNLSTGQLIAGSNTTALNALNGNGLLQQTVLNNARDTGNTFGSDFGARYEHDFGGYANSLTVGEMVFTQIDDANQAAVSTVLNDVRNGSNLYNVVALDGGGAIVGTLTNNGLVSYGNWGQGIRKDKNLSLSTYVNDELKIGKNLRIDGGVRYERFTDEQRTGNSAAVNQPVPAGTLGLAQDVGATFDGTYAVDKKTHNDVATTLGVNYLLTPEAAIYGRYAKGFQTLGTTKPTNFQLYEAGARYHAGGLVSSLTVFRTGFKGSSYQFIDPADPTVNGTFTADMSTYGVELDLAYAAPKYFRIDALGVFQKPKLNNVSINGDASPQYDGNVPQRTPKTLFTITPAIVLPDNEGQIYARYKYIGGIYADSGDGLALPAYGVWSAGFVLDLSANTTVNLSVDNLTNAIGLTEGNPRQGNTQVAVNGYFYGRAIPGRNAMLSVSYKF